MDELQQAVVAEEPAKTQVEDQTETPLESVASICTVLAVGLFLMTFVFQNYVIPSGSMEKTLLVGDHVFVDRITLAPPTKWMPLVHTRDVQRGDIIVFMKPNPETPDLVLVKRTIAIAGDRLHMVHGVVYLNGVAQNEPYAQLPNDNSSDSQDIYNPARDDFPKYGAPPNLEVWSQELPSHVVDGDLVVPPGYVFAMGDNREHSLDGRFWGFVPRQNIMGRPMFNYWSYDGGPGEVDTTDASMGARIGSFLSTALHFPTRTRWSRTLHLIK